MIVGTEDEYVEKCIEIIGDESKRRTEIVPSTASYDIGRYASFPVEVQVGGDDDEGDGGDDDEGDGGDIDEGDGGDDDEGDGGDDEEDDGGDDDDDDDWDD